MMTANAPAAIDVERLPVLIAKAAAQEKRARRRGVMLTALPLVAGFAWLAVSFSEVNRLNDEAKQLSGAVTIQRRQYIKLQRSAQILQGRVTQLESSQDSVLQFLADVTAGEDIRLIDSSVDWERTKKSIVSMPAGPRKTAVLGAILLAWKQLPFSVKNRSLTSGLDSPHFINAVLRSVGVE
ncbi:MAG: hypothetical protein ACREO5_15010, partial [Candidatus Binatia bacterium]